MKNKALTIIFGVCLFFLIITASIGLPIYLRFFYYIQINSLELVEYTGYSYAEIKGAYDSVINFLTLPFVPFSTGVLKYSEEGMAHFYDCKKLFNLNVIVLFISGAACLTLLILHKKKVLTLVTFKGFTVGFYAGICALVVPIVIGSLAATDFDAAFEIFHKIFFPGKDNWVFNPYKDEIITILPQEFFMNCAIFIGAGLIAFSAALIIHGIIKKSSKR